MFLFWNCFFLGSFLGMANFQWSYRVQALEQELQHLKSLLQTCQCTTLKAELTRLQTLLTLSRPIPQTLSKSTSTTSLLPTPEDVTVCDKGGGRRGKMWETVRKWKRGWVCGVKGVEVVETIHSWEGKKGVNVERDGVGVDFDSRRGV